MNIAAYIKIGDLFVIRPFRRQLPILYEVALVTLGSFMFYAK